jgi:hypothetical protein
VGPAPQADAASDPHVVALTRLFRSHPAWCAAAAHIAEGSTSGVWFLHRPGEPWHLVRERDETWLRPGPAARPDFVFRFSPASIRELEQAGDRVGDFAVRLFELMLEAEPERQVGFRIVAGMTRLLRRGYVGLLLSSGPQVAALAARNGVTGLASLRRLVNSLRRSEPYDWEVAV